MYFYHPAMYLEGLIKSDVCICRSPRFLKK